MFISRSRSNARPRSELRMMNFLMLPTQVTKRLQILHKRKIVTRTPCPSYKPDGNVSATLPASTG